MQEEAAVGVRVGAHPTSAFWRKRGEFALELALVVEQLLGPIALHPGLKDADVLGMAAHRAHRHLVRAPVALFPLAVDLLGTGPALRRPHDDHRPDWALGESILPRIRLDAANLADHRFERGGHELVHHRRVIAFDEMRRVAVSAKKRLELLMTDPRQHGRIGDLVAVEMQDRQHGAVAHRIQKLVGMPARRKRTGLRFAITDDGGHDEIGIVERRAEGMRKRVTKLATFVDRAGCLGRHMARNPARETRTG